MYRAFLKYGHRIARDSQSWGRISALRPRLSGCPFSFYVRRCGGRSVVDSIKLSQATPRSNGTSDLFRYRKENALKIEYQ
ncbi:hypothetical protein THIOM_002522 [Candidatus Thiomargarita nelsonii]|uniref:Uncharacterized protein n=1 Tax=Candidatus Thiomargarita nelsonii TaxID=1003181 RepID=A0A176S190_9GAMM|nr:hypothetical protein THIOM_002522 [Candidatus Thiomargarita nelsonii]